MISDDKIARLWGLLERSFNLAVCRIDPGHDENRQPCAQVAYLQEDGVDLNLLPDRFEGTAVLYAPYVHKPQAL